MGVQKRWQQTGWEGEAARDLKGKDVSVKGGERGGTWEGFER